MDQAVTKFSDEADDYELKLVGQTDAAWCVDTEEEQGVWLPKSQVECDRPRLGHVCTFTVPNWLAEKKGLL